ncbi:MAG: hypothetical protein ACLP0J_28135 [Solirubrobacteraceae bacterium]
MSEQRQASDSDTARALRRTFGVAPRSARAFSVPDVGQLSDGEREALLAAGEGMAEQLRRIVKRDCSCDQCRPITLALEAWDELRREGEAR